MFSQHAATSVDQQPAAVLENVANYTQEQHHLFHHLAGQQKAAGGCAD
jgi:hypothetical protein